MRSSRSLTLLVLGTMTQMALADAPRMELYARYLDGGSADVAASATAATSLSTYLDQAGSPCARERHSHRRHEGRLCARLPLVGGRAAGDRLRPAAQLPDDRLRRQHRDHGRRRRNHRRLRRRGRPDEDQQQVLRLGRQQRCPVVHHGACGAARRRCAEGAIRVPAVVPLAHGVRRAVHGLDEPGHVRGRRREPAGSQRRPLLHQRRRRPERLHLRRGHRRRQDCCPLRRRPGPHRRWAVDDAVQPRRQ